MTRAIAPTFESLSCRRGFDWPKYGKYELTIAGQLTSTDTCLAATTANITLSGEQTIDGVAVTALDRVLVKNQTTASTNGIYVVSTGAWTRATDFDSSFDVYWGLKTTIRAGSTNVGKTFAVSNTSAITLGTTALTFQQVPNHWTAYPMDITSSTFTGSVRVTDSIDSTSPTSITVTKEDAVNGVISFTLPGTTTDDFTVGRRYHYYILGNGPFSGFVQTVVMHGPLYVEA